jgi:uncharacterized protein YcnI
MTTRIVRLCGAGALALLMPMAVDAHVSITPRASTHGATEKYTARIPSEGNVATTAAEIPGADAAGEEP